MGFPLINATLDPATRQRVEDAAFGLQMAKMRHLAAHPAPDELLVGLEEIVPRIRHMCVTARDVVSVMQRVNPPAVFRKGDQDNLRAVNEGVRMESLYDTRNLSRPLLELMAAAELPYHCVYGPLHMKILDGERVLIDGPLRGGTPTVLDTDDSEVVSAAKGYVRAVRTTAMLSADFLERQKVLDPEPGDPGELLTERQRRIAEHLDLGATDEEVARNLRISVRTVRSEVASILQSLGARNRFGAGRRYGEMLASRSTAAGFPAGQMVAGEGLLAAREL